MKKINRASIIQKLVERFKLSNYSDDPFLLAETIQPTTNADRLTRTVKVQELETTSASAITHTFTVPAGKRWYPKVASGVSGAAVWLYVFYTSPAGATPQIPLNAPAATTDQVAVTAEAFGDIALEAGWSIVCTASASAANTVEHWVVYEEEDVV